MQEVIKITNRNYILIISFFTLTIILSVLIPNKYTQLFCSPATLIFITYIFREEIKNFNWNTVLKNDQAFDKSITAFVLALVAQTGLNFISITLMNPYPPNSQSLFLPIIPVYTVLFAPLIEEVIFRRIIYGVLQKYRERFSWFAASISSIIFAALHMNIIYVAGYFTVGMILCYFYFKTKNLYTTILAHMYFNLYVILVQSIHS